MTRDQMVSDHAGLVQACAWLMNGTEPHWDNLNISKEARKQIADIAQRLRDRAREGAK